MTSFKSEIKIASLHSEKDQQPPLDLDIVNLTLLLKSLGFKLNFLDFEKPSPDVGLSDKVTIDIKCHKSGLASKLSYDLVACNCPAEADEHQSAFWEVQGTSPKLMKSQSQIRDTSSSLLPEMSDSCAVMTKQILHNLLKHYRTDMQKSPMKIAGPVTSYLSTQPGPSIVINSPSSSHPKITPPAESPFSAKVTASTCEEPEAPPTTPSKILHKILDTIVPDSPVKQEVIELLEDNQDIVDLKNRWQSVASSKSNDKLMVDARKTAEQINKSIEIDHMRDAQVIQALTDARQKIDSALIFIKFNLAHDASQNTIVTTTPQTTVKRSFGIQRSSSSLIGDRRRSLGGNNSGSGRKPTTPVSKSLKGSTPQLNRTSTKIDTPRPTVIKKLVANVPATKKATGVPVLSKPAAMVSATTRPATASKVNSGLVRSAISNSLSKLPAGKK